MTANAPLDAGVNVLLHDGARPRPPLLDQLNRTVDRLFGFELEPEELLHLIDELPRDATRMR
jgi:hypothetical protein